MAPRGRHAAAVDALPLGTQLPELIVFDLDHTLWTPGLYTLRQLPNYVRKGRRRVREREVQREREGSRWWGRKEKR